MNAIKWMLWSAVAAILVVVLGCHSGGGSGGALFGTPTGGAVLLVSQSVGPAGGVVTVTAPGTRFDGAMLSVPTGALVEQQRITISTAPNAPAPEAINVSLGPEGLTFNTTTTLTLPYSDQFLAENGIEDPAQIRVASIGADSGIVEILPVIAVDTVAKTVTVAVTHFSIFSFFGSATQPAGFVQVVPVLDGPLKLYKQLPDSVKTERTLVIVHGICSSAEDLIGCKNGLVSLVKNSAILSKQYQRVFVFQYPWKRGFNGSSSDKDKSIENRPAEFWQRALSAVSGTAPTVDIAAHSMGGCVTRYALEIVDADLRARKAVRNLVMIGTPSGGTLGGVLIAIGCATLKQSQASTDLLQGSERLKLLELSKFEDFGVRYVTIAGDLVSSRHDVFFPGLGVVVTSVELGEMGSNESHPMDYEHIIFYGKPGAITTFDPAGHTGLHCRAAENATIGAFADITSNVSRTINVSSSNVASILVTVLRDPAIETITPSQGPLAGGTEITIAGVNFFNVSSVTIGGALCNNIHVNAAGDRLPCKTPAAASPGAADVIVASSTHQTATKKGGFLYTEVQSPTTWVKLSPSLSPPGRFGHALASDSRRKRAVLFGGYATNLELSNETWEFDGTTWIKRTPLSSPSARRHHAMAYDRVRSRVVLFGGTIDGATPNFNDTWEWDGTTWTQRFPEVNPPARLYHAMIYDARRDRMVLFGGFGDGPSYQNDTWEWDGTTWAERSPTRSPSVRLGQNMAYDSVRGRVVLFGGSDEKVGFNDSWEWDGEIWSEKVVGERPPVRALASMAFDPLRGRTVLFSGGTGPSSFNDTWEWDGTRWSKLSLATSPSWRVLHTMWFDEPNGIVMFFGGTNNAPFSRFSETWQLSP